MEVTAWDVDDDEGGGVCFDSGDGLDRTALVLSSLCFIMAATGIDPGDFIVACRVGGG